MLKIPSLYRNYNNKVKKIAKEKQYKYFGYTYKGEVRVKKADSEKYISIRKSDDLDLIA